MPEFFLQPGQLRGQAANLGVQLIHFLLMRSLARISRFALAAE